ncbi:PIN domain-containing protein [Acidothermaceae bacterium B102]|nr:PIN domain-containing protein [Acidothermaceae bacterium B102]
MIVVDASVLLPALSDDGRDGVVARARLQTEVLSAPELIDLEVVSVLRRLVRAGAMPVARAEAALQALVDLPLERVSHRLLLPRCWSLRDALTPYDASYVSLAEALEVTLVTADAALSRAAGPRCVVEVLR